MLTVAVLHFSVPLKRIYPGKNTLFGGSSPYSLLCLLQYYVNANRTKAKIRNGRKTKQMTNRFNSSVKHSEDAARESIHECLPRVEYLKTTALRTFCFAYHGSPCQHHKPYSSSNDTSQCSLMGQGLSLDRNGNVCWQPPGSAMYNKPIKTET